MLNTTNSPSTAPVLDAERLHVYAVAFELNAAAAVVLPVVSQVVRDQLERAALSVVLNVAEGAGRHSRRQKRYHYGVARGSAAECGAVADVVVRSLRSIAEQRVARDDDAGARAAVRDDVGSVRRLAIRCVQMLSRLETALGG